MAQQIGQGVEGDGVLQEHRPVGGDGEVVQESKASKAVAPFTQQLTGTDPPPGIINRGEFHQPDAAAGPGFHPEVDHAGGAMVAGVKAGVGTEGLAGFEHPIEQAQPAGFEAVGVEGVGGTGLPKGQQLIA